MKESVRKIVFDIGFSLIAYIFLIVIISSIMFMFNISISNLYSFIAIILVLVFQIVKDIKEHEDKKTC